MNLRTVEAAQIIVPISGFINIVGKDQRRITAFGRHLRFDNQRFIRRQFVSALIIELTRQRAATRDIKDAQFVDIVVLTQPLDMIDEEGRDVESTARHHPESLLQLAGDRRRPLTRTSTEPYREWGSPRGPP